MLIIVLLDSPTAGLSRLLSGNMSVFEIFNRCFLRTKIS